MQLLSAPTSVDVYPDTIDRTSELETNDSFESNLDQSVINIRAAAASYCVGGMHTHWTCGMPRLHRVTSLDELYEEAEDYLYTSQDPYNNTMLQTTVLKALNKHYEILEDPTWSNDVKQHKEAYPKIQSQFPLAYNFLGEELNNRVEFSKENKDMYGMPQPTFYFSNA
ncbi:hypothetical protein F8M41_003186 [Gigaspora margarita]|uniref:Uncharacterized protein n=1 Tax=Gigaspora margarita TaxID=4874 RepID=A0A8H3XBL9_GIGMA|nr:hypothetical protein F8M41_003186 [Gigaspora margarita]